MDENKYLGRWLKLKKRLPDIFEIYNNGLDKDNYIQIKEFVNGIAKGYDNGNEYLLFNIENVESYLTNNFELMSENFIPKNKITKFINEPIETIIEKPDYNCWKYYSKLLPLSKKIYLDMFGEPKTHAEWADSFNKIGRINRTIIKHANDGNNNKNSLSQTDTCH